jgi:hypothetical protein
MSGEAGYEGRSECRRPPNDESGCSGGAKDERSPQFVFSTTAD